MKRLIGCDCDQEFGDSDCVLHPMCAECGRELEPDEAVCKWCGVAQRADRLRARDAALVRMTMSVMVNLALTGEVELIRRLDRSDALLTQCAHMLGRMALAQGSQQAVPTPAQFLQVVDALKLIVRGAVRRGDIA